MGHIVLLGDLVFDNAAYVPDQPDVVTQLRSFAFHNGHAVIDDENRSLIETMNSARCLTVKRVVRMRESAVYLS